MIVSKSGPVISIRIDLEPPTDLPNKEACLTKAEAPGSANTGRLNTCLSSPTRVGSSAAAPAKAPPA